MSLPIAIELPGWSHVHTYRESHGDHVTEIYQRDPDPKAWSRRVETLAVSAYRDGRPSSVRCDVGPGANDYLLAREIRANAEGRYTPTGARHTEPCCTAGHETFEDAETGAQFRVVGVAGHGEWAFRLTLED
jgi:hypothetical protein